MHFSDAIQEYCFDCKVRKLSPRSISNYQKQLRYNPDVLSCIANLSSDEVFTPPEVANAVLDMLPQELFTDPNTTFLDPAVKSGVFLREIAKRLLKGLEPAIPDLQERIDHIFQRQLFGIAMTEITSLLGRRSLYCSKYPNSVFSVSRFDTVEGNIRYKNVPHRWSDGKCIFCGAAKSEYLKTSPAAKVKNVRQPKVLIRTFNEEEVLKMLNFHSGHDFISMRNKAMLALFFDTGMRLTEVMTMKDEQIRDGHVVVWGKGSKERVVPCSPYLARMLMKYRIARDNYFEMKNTTPQAYFFLSYRGKAMTQESVAKMMKQTAAAVNVRKDIRVSPHTCRHTFAHLQLKNGLDIYSLSRLLGHEHIGITQKYLNGIRDDEVLVAARQTGVLRNL